MIYTDTKIVRSVLRGVDKNYDVIAMQGGTYSGKTYGIMVALHLIMSTSESSLKIRVIGQTVPHLKDGALSDFEDITGKLGGVKSYSAIDKVYKIGNSSIKFLSVDKIGKAKGGKFDITFINECNEINYPIAKQLMLRTDLAVILDWNPTNQFWFHSKISPDKDKRILYKISTYKDNPSVSAKKIRDIEGLKNTDPQLYRVYALGLTGQIKGLIFRNVSYVPELPKSLKKWAYGLDFGFTNDPTALIGAGERHGKLYGKEYIYQTGLTNPDISKRMQELGIKKNEEIYADNAEPKSIEELRRMGWNIKAATKGKDSIRYGIQLLQKIPIVLTNDSLNWKKEAQNYKWKEKDGEALNIPIDKFNHIWDAARYRAVMKEVKKSRYGYA